MKHTEEQSLQDISRLLDDLNTATYGKERANGHLMPPNASNFYCCAKRLYDVTDELIEAYHPAYITENDYRFIYDSRRTVLLELSVMKDGNELQGDNLTWELEKYLLKIQGLFGCILLHCKSK
jgi:hypothetical protein